MNNNGKVLLDIRGVDKTYHSDGVAVNVLKNLDLQIMEGEIVFIMGPSGVGKSTLLNVIGTLDRQSAGQISIDGHDISTYSDLELARFRNERIGFIFQFHHLLPDFSALENVMMPEMIRANHSSAGTERATKLLEDVGLGHRLHHRPSQLSGGEQQRVAIARALMNQPRLILADEPTGDLDRANSETLFNLILKLNREYKQTFVIVTHDDQLAQKAHRIIYLRDGKVDRQEVLKEL